MKQWVFILLIGAVMTTYNTGNAVGSTDPRDLYDNAQNLDYFSVGTELDYPDRLGVPRKSLAGLRQQVADWLAAQGWEAVTIQYAGGAVVQRPTQLIERGGELYRVRLQSDLPLTLTGTFATDSPKLVAVGNQALRDMLSAADGATRIGYGATNVAAELDSLSALATSVPVDPKSYGAAGNATTNDTAAFTSLEAAFTGRTVDLRGKTYLVTAVPTKNAYINGAFKVGAASYPAALFNSYLTGAPKFTPYGNQLRNLKEALGNPLVQFVGIVGVGDSITWGRTLPDNSSTTPQTQLLDTARDNASSPSFWNNLRRYIGGQYMKGATLTLSNWAASPSGESIATYTKPVIIYPKDGPFTLSVSGANQTATSAARATSPTGWMYTLNDGTSGGAASQSISFNFTGTQFTLIFRATNTGDFNNYDVMVDGVSIGTFTTQDGVDGVLSGDNNRRTHTFSYVRNKTITIRTNSTGLTGVRRLYLEGIEIPKTVRFTNQGVIGQTARTYDLYNLSGSYSSPTAVTSRDQFMFVQFGTNDRGDTGVPPGAAEFERSMQAILNRLMPLGDVVLMVAGPVADSIEPPAPAYMTMRDIRGALSKVAKTNSLAFIDNLAAFESIDPSVILDGNTHPNALGHAIMSRNIINALESQ